MSAHELSLLAEKISSCPLCPLSLSRICAVPGSGPSQSEIMLVGEAPGREEDLKGLPFVGRAGRLLDDALAQAGINRSDVFITSVVKCRPPKNRKPKKGEIQQCYPYLQAQMNAIRPRIICLMGNTATQAVLGMQGITDLHGQILKDRFLVTYHPAAVLRNNTLMDDFILDLKKAKQASLYKEAE